MVHVGLIYGPAGAGRAGRGRAGAAELSRHHAVEKKPCQKVVHERTNASLVLRHQRIFSMSAISSPLVLLIGVHRQRLRQEHLLKHYPLAPESVGAIAVPFVATQESPKGA